jgi:amino acid adenylation domain-containing protein
MLSEVQRAALVTRLRRGRPEAGGQPAGQIRPRAAGLTELPLSYGQEQLWFLDRLAGGLAAYNVPQAVRLTGLLDPAALDRALTGVVARHEALRTRLVAGPGDRPVQVIDPPRPVSPELVDLSGHAADQQSKLLRELIDVESVRPFALAAGPLLRAWLVRLGDAEHVLLVVAHHTVFDGWSARLLLTELAGLYGREADPAGDAAAELPELAVQFADYALWERERLADPALLDGLAGYWRDRLAGAETLQFPTDHPRPVVEDFDGGLAHWMTDRALLDGLRELSRRQGTTLFVTLLAGLQAVLHRYTGQTDITVGTVTASRDRAELTPLIAFLVTTLPIRGDLAGDPPFTELLARIKDATVGAYAHQDLPFGKLVETLRVERDPGRSPLFQVLLTYAERDVPPVRAARVEFALSDLVVGISAAKFDLDFLAEARPGGLWLECSYKTGLFEPATIERLLGHLEVLLRGAVADPSARLSELPLLTPAERHAELVTWNDTAGEVPAITTHEGFAAQAARTPEAVAAEYEGSSVTYADLDRQASQIGRRLRELGVAPEVLVGVCMQPGLLRLAALLGIWKAGGGYVPLDPALPPDRLSFMITDAAMPLILTDPASTASLPGDRPDPTLMDLESERERIASLDDSDPGSTASPGNVAYVIYTSGSTGRPKGVMVEHRNLVNVLTGLIRQWRMGPDDAVLQFASLSFDVSVQDMFMTLLSGGRVVLAPASTLHSPPRLAALMRDRHVTFACFTPSMLSVLGDEHFDDLRVLMVAGEELPSELARRWIRPGLCFVNDYGPTETTVSATFMELDSATVLPPPIGRPYWPNYQAYVLDARLNPVPAGVTGELHIGGAGVTRGYLNRPELTRERFIPDPFRPGNGARLYKTGDLVRRRPDGTIVFLGRADGQVKVRGLRIELGEIETALAACPGIAQAVVMVVTDPAGDPQLAGYVRAEPGAAPDLTDVRGRLGRTLPGYMIPAHLITVTEFPLNTSGKIDKKALPGPAWAAAGPVPDGGPAAVATGTEAVLAELFATVLGRDRVGAQDSFFDLGGSSLAVMRLVDAIAGRLGADVGVATIFVHPTPRQLAASLAADAGRPGAARGPLTKLAGGGGHPPLILIHPIGGTVFGYAQLARELAGSFDVYGLEAPGLSQPGATAASLGALVADYAGRIRAAQPDGPYRLAGWSMGALIAFELARALERDGAEVSLLVLLDPPFDFPESGAGGADPDSPGRLAGRFVADAARILGAGAERPDPETASAADQLAWLAGAVADSDPDVLARLRTGFEVFSQHTRMLPGYTPDGPPVRAPALIVSADQSPNAVFRPRWPALLDGPAATLPLASDHYAFLRPPLVAEVARAIRAHPREEKVEAMSDLQLEAVAREGLAGVLDTEVDPADLDPDLDMADAYGLTSLNKVVFLMTACDDTGVSLSEFTEPDVAAMRTLRDVVAALARFAGTAA